MNTPAYPPPSRVLTLRNLHSSSHMSSPPVSPGLAPVDTTIELTADAVPLASLISATQPPVPAKPPAHTPAILSPDGFKRYFVVHGGLFSKDQVTLEDVRKIPRLGCQPGQEGLMCMSPVPCIISIACEGIHVSLSKASYYGQILKRCLDAAQARGCVLCGV